MSKPPTDRLPAGLWIPLGLTLVLGLVACRSEGREDNSSMPAGRPSVTATRPAPAFAAAPAPIPALASRDPQSAGALSGPLWEFGFEILNRQAAKTADDLVFSPVSLAAVLALTLDGAGGSTAQELRAALGLGDLPLAEMNRSWANLIGFINGAERSEGAVANSLWLAGGASVRPGFATTAADAFAAKVQTLPEDPEEARLEVNQWVATHTGGRITDLLQALDPATRLLLVNTVYAKVGWDWFDEADSHDAAFTLADGTKATVPTMSGQSWQTVLVTDSYDALSLQTQDRLSFWVFLPKGDASPEAVALALRQRIREAQGSPYGLLSDPEHEVWAEVDIQLPRFRIEHRCDDLVGDLQALGVHAAFDPGLADLSGMSDATPLAISQVVQKAMIDVNEQGIEAAAASAEEMAGASPPERKLDFHVNRPFLAVLTQDNAAVPLFMAIVRDPR
ncbi:MAG: serpin family protein [Anaerolineae bacterium]